MKEWTIESLFESLPAKYSYTSVGQKNTVVNGIAPLDDGGPKDLTICSSVNYEGIKLISKSDSGIILCSEKIEGLFFPMLHKRYVIYDKKKNEIIQKNSSC